MSASPRVSVVLPTYNRADLLPRAIRSVLAQTFDDFELIVVDDCSPSSMAPVVAEFGDPRIRFIRHEQNRGNAAARNTALRAARAPYIAFLDDDDEWAPEKLELQVPVLDASAPDEAMVYCPRRVIEDGRVVGVDAPGKEGFVLEHMLPWGLMSCPSVLLKKVVLDDIGMFDEKLARGVDDDLWRRIARKYRVRYIDRILVDTHVGHAERVSRIIGEKAIRQDIYRWEDKLEKFRTEFEARPAKHAIVLRRLGERYIQAGDVARGRALLRRAIPLAPLRADAYGMLIASYAGAPGLDLFLRGKEAAMSAVRPLLRLAGIRRRGLVEREQ